MILIFRQTGNNNTIVTTGVIVNVVVVVGVQESQPTANVSGAIRACVRHPSPNDSSNATLY